MIAMVLRSIASLGVAPEIFKERYLADMQGKDDDLFRDLPCPFQSGNLCGHYAARPANCRSYPHLANEGFRHRLHNVFDSYRVCPVVFFVAERLKTETGFAPGPEART